MSFKRVYNLLCLALLFSCSVFAQNQNKKWYFGNKAGLDFMTTPPTPLTGSMNTTEGCASVADAAGNLLFYTDGSSIWDAQHNVMGGGTGLGGNSSTTQSSIIVKQPGGQNIYYVFSLNASNNANLKYCVVDMSLAAGMGSVTSSNNLISTGNTERLTSVKHCNGVDIWVLCAPGTNSVNAYLVTSAGINTTAVGSSVVGFNSVLNTFIGYLKLSPNGSKIALANYSSGGVNIADFNTATGVVSNVITLNPPASAYGVEFSPDGTKLFATSGQNLYEWDLCAGSAAAIAASIYSVNTPAVSLWGMQLATDGKIYIARSSQTLAVINNPNQMGAAINYTPSGLVLAPTTSGMLGLPNFITSGFLPPPPAFTYTVSNSFGCQTAMFTSPAIAQPSVVNCSAQGSSVTGIWWNFGDPASGSANTSTLLNPSHAFTSLGTYTVKMVYNYSCGGGSDTVRATVIVNQPCINVVSQAITCASLGSATVTATGGIGPYTYTWLPSGQASSVAINLNPGTHTIIVNDAGNAFTYSALATFVSPVPFTGMVSNSSNLPCFGTNTGTASVQLSGGSGTQSYSWTSTSGTQTTATGSISGLYAGTYTLLVLDGVTSCSVNQTFFINQAPQFNLGITASTPTACVGSSISFTGLASGGTPGSNPAYTYSWLPGPSVNTRTVSQSLAGSYIYTLSAKDSNSCTVTATVPVSFIAKPSLTLNSVAICPQQVATLTVGGASSYTWADGSNGNTFSDNPLANTLYSLTGETAGCTSTVSASIILKAVPVPTLSSNSPVCNLQTLSLSALGGTAYAWSGPQSFTSALQNPQISPAQVNNSGVYTVTVTAINQCTASSAMNLTVHPTPTVLVRGDTICNTQNAVLQSTASAATLFNWNGPLSFTSALQNPVLNVPAVNASGFYTLVVSSAQGCTNSAVAGLTVSAMPTASFTTNSPLCQGSTLLFDASSSSGADYYSWSGPAGFFSGTVNPSISNVGTNASGIYTLQLTKGPCFTSFTNQVIVNPLPVPSPQSNGPICAGAVLQFSVNNYSAYQWSGPLGPLGSAQIYTYANAVVPLSGTYTVSVTDNNGCRGSATLPVLVKPNPVLVVTNGSTCYGSSAYLVCVGASTYSWTGPNNTSGNSGTLSIAQALNYFPEVYTVVATAANSCTSMATAVLSTYTLPVAQGAITPKACLNGTVQFSGSGGVMYRWNGPMGFNNTNQNCTLTVTNPGMAGTYTLVVTDDKGCSGSITASFLVDLPPRGYLWSSSTERCIPFCSQFGLTPAGQMPTSISWSLNGQPMAGNTFSYCFSKPGDYLINGDFISSIGCRNAQGFVVTARPQPTADFVYSPTALIENDEVLLENTSKGDASLNCTWYFGSNANSSSGEKAWHRYTEPGNYAVALLVKDQWNCTDTVLKSIKVEEDFAVFVPNAFTANSDNLNETFMLVGHGIRSFKLIVYDRWGERLFFTNDAGKGWDGSFGGKPCQVGTYAWTLELITLRGEEKKLSGHVTLLR